jgi:hypothetical protein
VLVVASYLLIIHRLAGHELVDGAGFGDARGQAAVRILLRKATGR